MIVPSVVLGQRAGAVPPSDKILLGGIGIGSRGAHVLSKFLNIDQARFVAICDVRNERRETIKSTADQKYGNRDCKMYADQYELLARTDIDAVLIATGDRWHTPLSIIAAQHGKDVYCEKPCSMSIEESWALAAAFKRYNRLYQAGCQRRNGANFKLCKELLESGALGKLQALYANVGPSVNWPPLPSRDWLAPEELPAKQVLDWDRWLGPAPWRPYHSSYVKGGWRNFYDFHGGGILEWGSHTVDLCQWGASADDTTPVEFEAEDQTIHGRYANGTKIVMRRAGFKGEGNWVVPGTCPIRFEGDEGWVEAADTGKIAVSSPKLLEGGAPAEMAGTDPKKHVRDFLDCIRTRGKPACNADITRRGHIISHAASIGWRLGRKVRFDPKTETFVNDPEANRQASRSRRTPWHA